MSFEDSLEVEGGLAGVGERIIIMKYTQRLFYSKALHPGEKTLSEFPTREKEISPTPDTSKLSVSHKGRNSNRGQGFKKIDENTAIRERRGWLYHRRSTCGGHNPKTDSLTN